MTASLLGRVAWARDEVTGLRDRLRPRQFLRKLDERKTATADLGDRLDRGLQSRLGRERLIIKELKTALKSRSPLAVLARGYCVAEKDGVVVRGTGMIAEGDRLKLRMHDGSSRVIVERVDHDGNI